MKFYSDNLITRINLEKWITRKWLSLELKRWYGRKNIVSRLILYVYEKLVSGLDAAESDEYLRQVHLQCKEFCCELKERKFKMLDNLLKRHGRGVIGVTDKQSENISSQADNKEVDQDVEEGSYSKKEYVGFHPRLVICNKEADCFHPRLVNITQMVLSKEEEDVLGKGFKHTLPPLNERDCGFGLQERDPWRGDEGVH